MKIVTRLIFALALALAAFSAQATYTPKEVEAAMKAGQTLRAEEMMRSVVAEQPKSARAHYLYAETLHSNAKDNEARQEAQRARDLDPAVRFTSRKRFDAFVAKLGGLSASSTTVPAARPSTLPPRSAPAPAPEPAQSGGHFWLWIFLLGGIIVGGIWFMKSRAKKEEAAQGERDNQARLTQLKRVTAMLESLRPLKVDVRLADNMAASLLPEVESIERELLGMAEHLSKARVMESDIDHLDRRIRKVCARLAGDESALSSIEAEEQAANARPFPGYSPSDAFPQQSPPSQGPIIIQQGGGGMMSGVGGVLAGMAIGSMLGGSHGGGHHQSSGGWSGASSQADDGFDAGSDFDVGSGGNDWGSGGSDDSFDSGGDSGGSDDW